MFKKQMSSKKYLVLQLQEGLELLFKSLQLLPLVTYPSYHQSAELLHMFCKSILKSVYQFLVLDLKLLLPLCSRATHNIEINVYALR